MNLSSLSLSIDVQRGGAAGIPPPVYQPQMLFNDSRNSQYVATFYSV